MIFVAKNIRQDRIFLAFKDQAHCDTRDRTLDRNAGIHHRKRTAADRRHRRRTIGFGDVAGQTDGVRKVFLAGQHGVQRTPCKLAMANFTTARRTKAADFTDRIRREVVVQHEAFIMQAVEAIDHLLRVLGTQGTGCDGLCFTTGEQRRTMRTRQEMRFRNNRADLGGRATIDALAGLQDRGTNDFGFKLFGQLDASHHLLRLQTVSSQHRLGLVARCVERIRTGRLVGQLVSSFDILADQLLELVFQRGIVFTGVKFPRILGSLFSQLDDRLDDFAASIMREHDGAEHDFFRKLVGFGFNHHHCIVGSGDDEVEIAFGNLLVSRVKDILSIEVTDARCADRAHEGNTRNGECCRCSDHREDIGLVFAIIAQNLSDSIDFIVETFGEKRTDRTVDKARNQRFLFGGATFTLEKATGDAACSRIFFLIVNGEREEILPFLHRLCRGNRAKYDCFAKGRHHSAVGLTGNLARFECQGFSAPLDRYILHIKHRFSLRCLRALLRKGASFFPGSPARTGRGILRPMAGSTEMRTHPI